MKSVDEAEQIRRASKSNLALSFVALSPERRRDITTFYAFCRVIDDIADASNTPISCKRDQLGAWREFLLAERTGEPPLAAAVRELRIRYDLPLDHFHEVLAGVEMDLSIASYNTWDELQLYCHRVASVVGLISIEIFGYRNPVSRQYAVELGLALQLTNILRDVGEDFANGARIYLPREDMARFSYSPDDLRLGRHDDRFVALMNFEGARADSFYQRAITLLPPEDRRSMIAAEIMRAVYQRLLHQMRNDSFRVFTKKYGVSALQKAGLVGIMLGRHWIEGFRGHPSARRLPNHET